MTIAQSSPRSLLWMARQEGRISWRDLAYIMTAGGRWRMRSVVVWIVIVVVIMHLIAWGMVRRYAGMTLDAAPTELTALSGSIGLGAPGARSARAVGRGHHDGDDDVHRRTFHQRAGLSRWSALALRLRRRRGFRVRDDRRRFGGDRRPLRPDG